MQEGGHWPRAATKNRHSLPCYQTHTKQIAMYHITNSLFKEAYFTMSALSNWPPVSWQVV